MKTLKVSDEFTLKQDDKRPHVFWVFKEGEPYLAVNNKQIFFYCSKTEDIPVDLIARALTDEQSGKRLRRKQS